ncbi:AlpA family phage regulatory protein [Saccharibacter sp. 17.LH.SD]|uniref:helix-turn-helix transcriptional regulator n=1 Tax=Saccharibacter sp. 17.LH.SD TaxID=2689393 RepID=UPI001367DC99|nr:AlpA family phage regulatory protein [Saccharibacter sp. 17.LH.SD]MXV44700.1 AlpA family phage regulatory protein [Saccharibacter sp. 17.LH.SD]
MSPLILLNSKETAKRVNLSVSSLYRHVNAGLFPRPVRITSNRVGWLSSELDSWIEARITERDTPEKGVKV